ncbi:MAG: Protein OS-9 [Pycnora praestabilis]|nr:MAG: Protein OS-9 [Pycnora praestabilis]
MRRALVLLAAASVVLGSQSVFSVHDDLLAFPQYEIIFSDTFISDLDAASRLVYAASSSSARPKATPIAAREPVKPFETTAELLHVNRQDDHGHWKTDDEFDFDDSTDTYESMILNGKPYLCAIPIVEIPIKNETSEAAARAEEEKEIARATDRGWELLQDMEGHCLYFISGWWSYSFCYNSQVKQFHQLPPTRGAPVFPPQPDPSTATYVLGQVGAEGNGQAEHELRRAGVSDGKWGLEAMELQARGETRYLVQKLGGGTTCDLTGKDRRVEVQFHCHPQSADRIGWIKEVTTCSYLMVIYTARLCNDIAFLPPHENKANPIACREVVPAHAISDWKAQKTSEAERKLLSSADPSRPVIGGVEVGGQKMVGMEGRRIDASKVAGGGANAGGAGSSGPGEVVIVAINEGRAKGGKGKRLSSEELEKLNLDPEAVERFKKELQEMAGDEGWKLEVVEKDDGQELRGTIEELVQEGEGNEDGEAEGEEGSEEEYKEDL